MILLFSGGIDSYVAWHHLAKPPTVYFNLGTRYSEKEMRVVLNLVPNTIVNHTLKLGHLEQKNNAYIPFRNLHLALHAYQYDSTISICGIKDDNVSDKTPDMFTHFSAIMSQMEGRVVSVTSPFGTSPKQNC